MIKFPYLFIILCVAIACTDKSRVQDNAVSKTADSSIYVDEKIAISEDVPSRITVDTTYRRENGKTVTVLSNGKIFKTFVSKDPNVVVKHSWGDSTWISVGSEAQILIYSKVNSSTTCDTITITRGTLNKVMSKAFKFDRIEEFDIWQVYFEYVKNDTIAFSISLNKPDTDYSFNFLLQYNCITGKYSIELFDNEDDSED